MKIWKHPCSKLRSSDGGEWMFLDEGENCPGWANTQQQQESQSSVGRRAEKARKCCLQLEGPRQWRWWRRRSACADPLTREGSGSVRSRVWLTWSDSLPRSCCGWNGHSRGSEERRRTREMTGPLSVIIAWTRKRQHQRNRADILPSSAIPEPLSRLSHKWKKSKIVYGYHCFPEDIIDL